jgi:hypothetical protein
MFIPELAMGLCRMVLVSFVEVSSRGSVEQVPSRSGYKIIVKAGSLRPKRIIPDPQHCGTVKDAVPDNVEYGADSKDNL